MSEIRTLHEPFAAFLRQQGIEFIRARSDRESTIAVGWPDFSLVAPTLPAIFIEFKTKEGKESREQSAVRERLTAKGFRVFVVRDLAIAVELVTAWKSGQEPQQAPCAPRARLVVRNRPGHGSWVHDGQRWLRKALVDDLRLYPNEP